MQRTDVVIMETTFDRLYEVIPVIIIIEANQVT